MKTQYTPLTEQPFTYQITKDHRVFLFWYNKPVMVLKGKQAHQFLNKIEHETESQIQLRIAKITGNFKRGNEGHAKNDRHDPV